MTFEPTYSYDKKKRAAIEPWKCVPLLSIRHLKDKTSLKKCEKNHLSHSGKLEFLSLFCLIQIPLSFPPNFPRIIVDSRNNH